MKNQLTSGENHYDNGVAYINTTNTFQAYTVNGMENIPLFIALGHEMAHGMDPQKKSDFFGSWIDTRTSQRKNEEKKM